MNDTGWFAYSPIQVEVDPREQWSAQTSGRPEWADVGRLARRATRKVIGTARADLAPSLAKEIAAHIGRPDTPVVQAEWAGYEHVNVCAGVDAWLARPGREHRIVGVSGGRHDEVALEDLLAGSGHPFGPRPANVTTIEVPSGPGGQTRACVTRALYFVVEADGSRLVVLLRSGRGHGREGVGVEVLSPDPAAPRGAIEEIRALVLEHNVFRGQVLSFDSEMFGDGESLLRFHERPALGRHALVLPAGVLESVERQVVTVNRHKAALLASGQHLKRGLLLYGPPGTGKTHTIRYLLGVTPGVTVLQLTGNTLGMLGAACSVARALTPALIVVEDVDLIAEDRDMYHNRGPLLFQLLNEMDGLAEDADVMFVLTTNRPEALEPALAARPGRVDQAVELSLPDATARRALLELYSGGLVVESAALDDGAAQTDGVTASFLKELLRRSAVIAVSVRDPADEGPIAVAAEDLAAALAELTDTRNAMTRASLGGGTHFGK